MGSRTEKNSHFKELYPASEAGAIENARAGLGLDIMAEIAGTLNPSLRGLRGMRALVERLRPGVEIYCTRAAKSDSRLGPADY